MPSENPSDCRRFPDDSGKGKGCSQSPLDAIDPDLCGPQFSRATPVWEAIHFRHKPHHLEAGLLQYALRSRVCRVREGSNFGQLQRMIGDAHAGGDHFRGVAPPPDRWVEEVAHLDAPAWIERVIIESAPADDPSSRPSDDRPWSVSITAATPLVNGNPTTASTQGRIDVGVLHRCRVTQELKQERHIGEGRATQNQTRRFDIRTLHLRPDRAGAKP